MGRLSDSNLLLKKSGFMLFVILSLVSVSCSNLFNPNEITIYCLICVKDPIYIMEGCDGRWATGNRTVYKIFPENQEVVHYHPGISSEPLKEKDCVIADKNNWKCTYSDKSGIFGCRGGKFYTDPPYPDIVYVSKWRWWHLRIKGHLK